MTVTDPRQLTTFVDLVHDWWFDLGTLVFDQARKTVTLRVHRNRSALANPRLGGIDLDVRNVNELIIKDTERVGYYDINEIVFNAGEGTILLTGGIPIELIFRVSALDIRASALGESSGQ